ncbi:MAG TPA: ABC transporter ATP-binding protein [Alphaproteobacteria bacterium]|nr:ABC transporter ATP-binding protein [Alphaproteobacteria bacterium]
MRDTAPLIRLERLSKRFGQTAAVDDVSLDIRPGELFSLLGASGSGKTTLLRLLGGFESPSEGRVVIDGVDVTDMPAYERPTNMVFQSYALFPHMSVEANVGFGLRQAGVERVAIKKRVAETLEMVQLRELAARKPAQLSGGQRQRVALARALVLRPKVLLLDEPLSALDKKLREHTQFELMRLQRQLGITFVMVTHDQEEAMAMSTRIAIMDKGRVVEVGTPRQVYERPQCRFVADFIGGANILEAIPSVAGRARVPALGIEIAIADPLPAAGWIALRPERVALSRAPSSAAANCTVEAVAFHGDFSLYRVRLESGTEFRVAAATRAGDPEPGDRVFLSWPEDAPIVLTR